MKTSILVGGQAVIEGVMMRVPGAYATALRLKNGEIISKRFDFTSIIERYKMKNYFIIRGFLHLYESMKIGYQTLDWSADIYESENNNSKKNKESILNTFFEKLVSIFSIVLSIGIFLGLPLYFSSILIPDNTNSPFYFNIISGIIRITIFLVYLILISQLNDVKRLFQYHGAEHKTVYNFESGKELNIKNAQKFSTLHPRCGTSFIFIIMIVTIFSYTILDSIALLFIDNLNFSIRLIMHLLCLPLVAGIGYEVLKFLSNKQHILIFKYLSKPGLLLQNITTKEPDDLQLEIAIYALKTAFDNKIDQFKGKKYTAESIG
tara:strand:+ start:2054 stop:3013 length:960 start_codon:yes stop_codon:yes gene_type:complete